MLPQFPHSQAAWQVLALSKWLVLFLIDFLNISNGFEQFLIDFKSLTLCFSHPSLSPVCLCVCAFCLFGFVCVGFFPFWWLVSPSPALRCCFTLQNSSSSASSEASETCQSVSECSSPTSVSSGSTMGAWASTDKVKNFISKTYKPTRSLSKPSNVWTNKVHGAQPGFLSVKMRIGTVAHSLGHEI